MNASERKLVASHRLERVRRSRMPEKREAWKREAGFDPIEIIAEMNAQRLHAGFDLEPLYNGLYNPRWPHSPEDFTLKMSVDVEKTKAGNSIFGTATAAAR